MKAVDADLQYLLWMTEVACLSPVKGVKLLEELGSAKAVWEAGEDRLSRLVKLEDGEKQRCVQLISRYGLYCKYFLQAVLPVDRELFAQIMEHNN